MTKCKLEDLRNGDACRRTELENNYAEKTEQTVKDILRRLDDTVCEYQVL